MYNCAGWLCVIVLSFVISITLFPEIDVDGRIHLKRQQVNLSTPWSAQPILVATSLLLSACLQQSMCHSHLELCHLRFCPSLLTYHQRPAKMCSMLLPEKQLYHNSQNCCSSQTAPTGIERLTLAWLRQPNTQHFHCRQAALVAFLVISMRPPRRHLALQLLHLPQADL